jgi:hypothetical protein
MPGPFEEIDMAEAEHAAWVKAQRDPALWHQAAMATLAYLARGSASRVGNGRKCLVPLSCVFRNIFNTYTREQNSSNCSPHICARRAHR